MVRARRAPRVRVRKNAIAELTRTKRRTGERLGVRSWTDVHGKNHEIDEKQVRAGQLTAGYAHEIGEAEAKRLYSTDARLVRNPQEMVGSDPVLGRARKRSSRPPWGSKPGGMDRKTRALKKTYMECHAKCHNELF